MRERLVAREHRRSTGLRVATLALLAAVLAAPAAAAFPTSRLVYTRSPAATPCPDESVVRREVKARLGYDPFFPTAERTIVVMVDGDSRRLRGKVYLVDGAGLVGGLREFAAGRQQCDQLVHAMALAISIAVDPTTNAEPVPATTEPDVGPSRVPAAPDPAPASRAVPVAEATKRGEAAPARDVASAPADAVSPTAAAEPGKLRAAIALGVHALGGAAPGPIWGARLSGSVRRQQLSIGLEASAGLPASFALDGREVQFSVAALSLLPCWHWDPFVACLALRAGRVTAAGAGPDTPPHARFPPASGLRAGAELALFRHWAVRLDADVMIPLVRVRVFSSGSAIWESPSVFGSVGVAAVAHFP